MCSLWLEPLVARVATTVHLSIANAPGARIRDDTIVIRRRNQGKEGYMARHMDDQRNNLNQLNQFNQLNQRELVITRVLDASREDVWDLCTERAHAMEWWGPRDFTVSAFEMDLRPGGTWRAVIRSPQGQDYSQYGTYELVDRPENLAFTFVWQKEGPDSEMLCTLSLKEAGSRTEMTFRKSPFPSAESRNSELDGWNECFDRLEKYLERSRIGSAQPG